MQSSGNDGYKPPTPNWGDIEFLKEYHREEFKKHLDLAMACTKSYIEQTENAKNVWPHLSNEIKAENQELKTYEKVFCFIAKLFS